MSSMGVGCDMDGILAQTPTARTKLGEKIMSDIYYDLSASDSEAIAAYTKQLAQQWLKTTVEGMEFSRHYDSEANVLVLFLLLFRCFILLVILGPPPFSVRKVDVPPASKIRGNVLLGNHGFPF